jgi:multifunctional beta-oxidation protein
VPLVAALTHPDGPNASGKVFEVGAGFVAEIRWERTKGALFKTDSSFTPSAVRARWDEIVDFTNPSYPDRMGDQDMVVSLNSPTPLSSGTQSHSG